MPELPSTTSDTNDLMEKLKREKDIALKFQERRHPEWDDNYTLYRNKIRTNRLTQRQAVNIPLLKETIKTTLSKIDESPQVDWQELSGDKDKELILQEKWNQDYLRLNMEALDIQDKKNQLMTGRGIKKLNWSSGCVEASVLDSYDFLVDPMVNSLDIDSSRFVVHHNIFRSLRDILADERYTAEGKKALKIYLDSKFGIVQTSQNKEELAMKQARLEMMGVNSADFALFAAGDIIVNLSEHYTHIWDEKKKKFEWYVAVYADNATLLMKERLLDLIGVDFLPFVTWGDDIESNDFWSDGIADLVRTPNKIVNIWFSQLVENRTLRNFQMHWYDATIKGYKPQTYEPGQGRMLPAPGDPNKTIMPVNIQGLDETLTAIDFVIKIVERGSGATAMEKGIAEKKQVTLGEVNVLVGQAMERSQSMQKFYRRNWEEFCMKWYKLYDANASKKETLYKVSSKGKIWPKVVYPVDWRSDVGYRAMVHSTSEQEEENMKGIQKFQLIMQQSPNNAALRKIGLKRMLEMVDLTPEEMREVQEEEKKVAQQAILDSQAQLASQAPQPQAVSQPGVPQNAPPVQSQPGEAEEVAGLLDELARV